MSDAIAIRRATAADRAQLREAIIELQDYEHRRHPTRLPGVAIADRYLAWMEREAGAEGAVLIVSDLCVMPSERGQRIAHHLLDALARELAVTGITRLRINSVAANAAARSAYERAGFTPYEITYEKPSAGEERHDAVIDRGGEALLCGGAALRRGAALAGRRRGLRERAARALRRARPMAHQGPHAAR
jgi:GNAT superfamily N-acetyltransferase